MFTAPGTWSETPRAYLQSGRDVPSTTACVNGGFPLPVLAEEHVWTQEQSLSNFNCGQNMRGRLSSHGSSSVEDDEHARVATPSPERTYRNLDSDAVVLPHWQSAALLDALVGNRHQSTVNYSVPCPPEYTVGREPRAYRSRQSVQGKQTRTAADLGRVKHTRLFAPCLSDLNDSCRHGPVEKVVSKGSVGHPNSCGLGCKYANKPRGCKDGINCTFCHICLWSRSALKSNNVHSFAEQQDPDPTSSGSESVERSQSGGESGMLPGQRLSSQGPNIAKHINEIRTATV